VNQWRAIAVLLLACSAHAATILQTGDSLAFPISDRGFVFNSLRTGGPAAPTGVSFVFTTEPLTGSTLFDATLESRDGSVSVSLGAGLSFQPGSFQGTYYSGPASVLFGRITLPETVSSQLFAGNQAVLVLQNIGPAITLGLSSYTLAQELDVSLSGTNLSVGALGMGAALTSYGSNGNLPEPAPEPPSGLICAVVGGLFIAAGRVLKHFSRRRIK